MEFKCPTCKFAQFFRIAHECNCEPWYFCNHPDQLEQCKVLYENKKKRVEEGKETWWDNKKEERENLCGKENNYRLYEKNMNPEPEYQIYSN